MADNADVDSDCADENGKILGTNDAKKGGECAARCCGKKCGVVVCVNCFSIYHKSCGNRMSKLQKIGGSKVICCETKKEDLGIQTGIIDKLQLENSLLKRLLSEMEDKNHILKENNRLLIERAHSEKIQQKIVNKSSNSSSSGANVVMFPIDKSKTVTQGQNQPNDPATVMSCEDNDNPANVTANVNSDNVFVPTQKDDDNNEDEWTTVVRKGSKTNREALKKIKNERTQPLLGTNKNHGNLQLAQRKQWIFVSGLAPKTEAKDVIKFLEDNNIMGCTCEKMLTKTKQVGSFKLSVAKEKVNQIMNAELWPEGIRFNHFRNLQRRLNDGIPPSK